MRKPLSLIRDVVFFTGYYLYVGRRSSPNCTANSMSRSFPSIEGIYRNFSITRAVCCGCISDFFSQFYLLPWIGALVITGIAIGITLTTRKISDSVLKSRSAPIFDLFPAIFLLVLHNQFFHNLTVDIGILFTLSVFYLHITMSFKNRLPRIAVTLFSGA